jgi:hypothetical protein
MADDILAGFEGWAKDENVNKIDFTYGVLYGTPNQSNKKDWHILRNIEQKIGAGTMVESPKGVWGCRFEKNGISVNVTIRIGIDLWNYFGGLRTAFLEVSTAIIRACIAPTPLPSSQHTFTISDLASIISIEDVDAAYNVSLLQRSQLEWLFFFARHFCDILGA